MGDQGARIPLDDSAQVSSGLGVQPILDEHISFDEMLIDELRIHFGAVFPFKEDHLAVGCRRLLSGGLLRSSGRTLR